MKKLLLVGIVATVFTHQASAMIPKASAMGSDEKIVMEKWCDDFKENSNKPGLWNKNHKEDEKIDYRSSHKVDIKVVTPKVDMRAFEKIMCGNDFSPVYKYELVQKNSTKKNIKIKQELDTYCAMVDNALMRINERRDILKKKLDNIITSDAIYLNKGSAFWQIFIDILQALRIFFRHEDDCNVIDAYNHLTSMKNRLKKSVEEYIGKHKMTAFALTFKKQEIYLNKDAQNENVPKEIILKHIVPYLPSGIDCITVSQKDIVLSAYWSDGVWGWMESMPPQGGIVLGSGSIRLCGEVSNVLYDAPYSR